MQYPLDLLDRLQAITASPWQGLAYRHMFASYPPNAENTRGARWNPPGIAAIYLSLVREGALAEAEHVITMQPVRPTATRTIFTVSITLRSVLDLTNPVLLAELGVGSAERVDPTMHACRVVGGAVASLAHDAVLVPSARSEATNLVIFAANRRADCVFDVVRAEVVAVQ